MPKQFNAQSITEKWSRNLAGSGESIRAGVDSVTESPGEAAIRAKDAMLRNFQQSMNDGTYEAGCRSFSLADWKQNMKTTGVNRISEGATKAKPKMQAFMQQWLPIMAQASADAKAIPKVTEQDALNRVLTVMRAGKQFKQSRAR